MITKNYKMIVNSIFPSCMTGRTMFPIKTVTGVDGYVSGSGVNFASYSGMTKSITGKHNSAGIMVGSGTTPANENDYKLEKEITNVSGSCAMSQKIDDNGDIQITATLSVVNKDNIDVTVSEVGLLEYAAYTKGQLQTNPSASTPILLDRSLLNTPVTIKAGETGIIQYIFTVKA